MIICEELMGIVDKFGDEWCMYILYGFDGDVLMEDFIVEEEMVVIVMCEGYIKCMCSDNYCFQYCGGKGVKGVQLCVDDIVEYFFVMIMYYWLLFFIDKGCVYCVKIYEVLEVGWDVKGMYVVNFFVLQLDESIVQVFDICDYVVVDYLVLVICEGLVKKICLDNYDMNCQGGVIVICLNEDDELVSVFLVNVEDDILFISC